MPPNHIKALPVSQWSDQELTDRLWKTGNLKYLCYSQSQQEIYDAFYQWNAVRRDPAKRAKWRAQGLHFARMQVWEIARRWGKSALTMILAVEHLIRNPNSQGMFFTKTYSSILDIYVPLVRILFSDAPEGYKPVFVTASAGQQCGFKIPAVNGFIHMVGVDREPDVNRGQGMDFVIGTECAFVKNLEDLMISVINPMFQGRPWGWTILESSTAVEPDCDFNKHFREDARSRGAYHSKTIRDNDALTEEEIQDAIAECGGLQSAKCQRELFCVEARDDKKMVVPEFNEAAHVVGVDRFPRPAQAFCYVGMDPGVNPDKCGIVFFYVDFLRNKVVVVEAYADNNKSTEDICKVIKATEKRLWGSGHRGTKIQRPEVTYMDLLKPTALVDNHGETQAMLSLPENLDQGLMWWDNDAHAFRPNPVKRVSDVAPQVILDLRETYQLPFEAASKGPGSKDAHLNNLRTMFGSNMIEIIKNGRTEPLIEQLRSGVWNDKGTDWKRTPTLGHLDCLQALSYTLRTVNLRKNPFKPDVDPRSHNVIVEDPLYRERLNQIFKAKNPKSAPKPKFDRSTASGKPKQWR